MFSLGESIVMIPLGRISPNPHGVRRTNGIAIDGLAASIYAEGLLQNLTVIPDADSPLAEAPELQNYQVVAGNRRMRAMRKLVADGRWTEDREIPCRVIHEKEALTASLAENMIREPMHPADEFVAFRDMIDEGKSVEDVAARFGVTPIAVQRRLRLANVSPRLFELFREGGMSIEQITALAIVDDHKAQEKAWFKAEHKWQQEPKHLREVLTKKEVSFTSDPIARFVGRKEYEAAGGVTHVDLFSDADEGYALDGKLLQRIAAKRLDEVAELVRKEGWSWVEIKPDFKSHELYQFHRAEHIGFRKPDDVEKKRLQEIETERKAIDARLKGIEASLTGEDDYLEDHPEAEMLQDRNEELLAEQRSMEESRKKYDAKIYGKCGVIISVENGALHIHRGLSKGKLPQQKPKKKSGTGAAEDESKATHSEALVRDLSRDLTYAIQAEFIANPGVAIIELTHRLLLDLFDKEGELDGDDTAYDMDTDTFMHPIRICRDNNSFLRMIDARADYSSPDAHRFLNERDAIRAMLPKRCADWRAWLHHECKCISRLLAFCVAHGTDATFGRSDDDRAQPLMRELQLDMTSRWTPRRENYLSRVSADTIKSALAEAEIDDVEIAAMTKLKKGELADAAEKPLSAARWIPREFRIAAQPDQPPEGKSMKRSKGFTLIELMIVVAIIAILAAIALPAYQDYVIRSQVTEGLSLADGAKTSVSEFFSNRGVWPTDNASAGLASSASINGNYVTSVAAGGTPTVVNIMFGNKANAALNGLSLQLNASAVSDSGSIQWSCTSAGIAPKYLPTACRQ